ncbi:MAG: pilus assembly protein PilM, partial [Verrucomicrobiota bacterium]
VHLQMNATGRCDVVDYLIEPVRFSTTEPLLWLKASSQLFGKVKKSLKADAKAGFTLPGHLALTKYLKIPRTTEKKRQKIVAYEARQNIPYPMNEVTWDDCPVQEDDLDFETVISAAKTDLVEALSLYGREAKMDPEQIEPAFISLLNGFRFNYPEASGCILLLSVGAKSTDLIYIDEGRFYSRNVAIGGNAVSQEVSDALGIPFEDADALKVEGLRGDELPDLEKGAFETAVANFRQRLSVEIIRTTAIFKRQGYENAPQRVYLTGGGTLLPKLEETLSDQLSVPVERYDPLKKVRVDSLRSRENVDTDKAFLGDAIGMAIGRFLPDACCLNLIPQSLIRQRKFTRQKPFYLVAGLVASAAAALPVVSSTIEIGAYEQENLNLVEQIEPLGKINKEIHEKREAIDKLRKVVESSAGIADSRSNWLLFLNDVQERMLSVEDVWLDRVEVLRNDEQKSVGTRFDQRNNRSSKRDTDHEIVRLRLEGRLIDVRNPMSKVSPDSYSRVKALLDSFKRSAFIAQLEDERFDNAVPGILKFNFTLVVNPERPL